MTLIANPATRGRLYLFAWLIASPAIPCSIAYSQHPSTVHPLTLAEAWTRAEAKSDQIAIAEARREQARGGALEASSLRRPHLSAYSAYDRTLRSEFDGITGFAPDSATTSDDQSAEIPFGSAHAYRAGLTASYMVFAGGRSIAQARAAASARRAAEIGSATTTAQVRLDVTQAYYDAMLADRLLHIAEWTLEQAESTYRRVVLLADAGRSAEFDVVRAKATRDRGRPGVIQRESARDIAVLRLRQLLHWPATEELALPIDLLATAPPAPSRQTLESVLRSSSDRTPVREAAALVEREEHLLQASQAGRLPAVSLTSTYERVAYPLDGSPSWRHSRANWTVGARVELPIITGGKQQGSDALARAEVDAARARLRLTRELAELDARSAASRLAAAEAALVATQASVDEASRAYAIAQLRYREGVSIQLELSDARLLLEQARADQARAARDVSIERVRATLLPDLPLGSDAVAGSANGRAATR